MPGKFDTEAAEMVWSEVLSGFAVEQAGDSVEGTGFIALVNIEPKWYVVREDAQGFVDLITETEHESDARTCYDREAIEYLTYVTWVVQYEVEYEDAESDNDVVEVEARTQEEAEHLFRVAHAERVADLYPGHMAITPNAAWEA